MQAKTVLITGANRGLGLQFVNQLLNLETPPQTLIATCRDVENATELKQVAAAHQNLKILQLDVDADIAEERLENVVKKVGELLNGGGINLMINNAGRNSTHESKLTKDVLTKDFTTNVFAPILLTKALQPFLERAAKASPDAALSCSKAAVINISSILGSIAQNQSAGMISYKTTKCALNMVSKTLANDLGRRGILCMAVHPGWVQTDMGGQSAPLTPEASVAGMLSLLGKCGSADNGKYYQYDGQELPW